jgi:hypothetical protein
MRNLNNKSMELEELIEDVKSNIEFDYYEICPEKMLRILILLKKQRRILRLFKVLNLIKLNYLSF